MKISFTLFLVLYHAPAIVAYKTSSKSPSIVPTCSPSTHPSRYYSPKSSKYPKSWSYKKNGKGKGNVGCGEAPSKGSTSTKSPKSTKSPSNGKGMRSHKNAKSFAYSNQEMENQFLASIGIHHHAISVNDSAAHDATRVSFGLALCLGTLIFLSI